MPERLTLKRQTTPTVGTDVHRHSYAPGAYTVAPCGETVGQYQIKLNAYSPENPALPFLGIHPTDMLT